MSGRRLATFAIPVLALFLAASEGHAQRYGGRRAYGPAAPPGYAYPAYLATPYTTWYNYYPEPYRYPREYGLFAPARMYADPYVSPYGPRFGRALPYAEMAPAPAPTNAAYIEVSVPATAEILFDGSKTTQTGTDRLFETPELEPGKEFEYEVTARWQQDGKPVEEKKAVTVRAGQRVRVDFSSPK
ncbi:MAG: TIGR03000 domain-containing protein [Gemmataceae bacterium]